MKLIYLIDRLKNSIVRYWRKKVFKEMINCNHVNFKLIGKVNVINRNIEIGTNCVIYPDVTFFGNGEIKIGNNVSIGQGCILYASKEGGITIGNDTLIAAYCYIIDTDHGIEKEKLIRKQKNNIGKIIIGEDVWIGAGCKVLRGSKINDGAVIGASSLVKSEIKSNSVVVGVPVHCIKMRQ